jgi:hypothetical protein
MQKPCTHAPVAPLWSEDEKRKPVPLAGDAERPMQLQYRALDGDTGETAGGHWCGAPDESGHSFFTYCAILPPSTALLDEHVLRRAGD